MKSMRYYLDTEFIEGPGPGVPPGPDLSAQAESGLDPEPTTEGEIVKKRLEDLLQAAKDLSLPAYVTEQEHIQDFGRAKALVRTHLELVEFYLGKALRRP